MTAADSRRPRVFAPGDPGLVIDQPEPATQSGNGSPGLDGSAVPETRSLAEGARHGIRWGAMLLSAMAGLTALAAGLAWTRFVSDALLRHDWVGWTALGLAGVAALAGGVLILREVIGLFRLARLGRLRKSIDAALAEGDVKRERGAVLSLKALYAGRHDMRWGLQRLSEHERDLRDPGELLRLADRELVAPLDIEARRLVLKSAKRVSVVTAMSPMAWVAMVYVVIENLRMIRALAGLYGGRPGLAGSVRLARLVIAHILATGGVAMTDDLIGQFLGQDVLRRLSRRLGEGAFNGALTARLGTAAIEVTRPMPFLDAEPVRVRNLLPELFKKQARA